MRIRALLLDEAAERVRAIDDGSDGLAGNVGVNVHLPVDRLDDEELLCDPAELLNR